MLYRAEIIVVAFVLDLILGDPHFLWHPVRGIGFIITYTEKLLRRVFKLSDEREQDKAKKRLAGIILVIIVIMVSVLIPLGIIMIGYSISHWAGFAIECIMSYRLLAMKSLRTESMAVYKELKANDIEGARNAVSMIVGRDTAKLDEEGITKAAVETVAENSSDGVIAPLFFMFVFGTVGAWLYKAINTMDSMIGYKNDKYLYFGTASAKLDDAANFIPARIAGLGMVLAAFLIGLDGKNAWKIFKRDRFKHASPNSAQTEAACAGALGVQLAGDAYYFGELHEKPYIGDALRPVNVKDIKNANRLMYATSIFILTVGLAVLLLLSFL